MFVHRNWKSDAVILCDVIRFAKPSPNGTDQAKSARTSANTGPRPDHTPGGGGRVVGLGLI
jgi:hypothetical protein